MEQQRHQVRVGVLVEAPDALVGGQLGRVGAAQIERHALEQPLIVVDVPLAQLRVGLPRGGVELALRCGGRVSQRRAIVAVEAGGCGEVERDPVGVFHVQLAAGGADAPALGQHAQLDGEGHSRHALCVADPIAIAEVAGVDVAWADAGEREAAGAGDVQRMAQLAAQRGGEADPPRLVAI